MSEDCSKFVDKKYHHGTGGSGGLNICPPSKIVDNYLNKLTNNGRKKSYKKYKILYTQWIKFLFPVPATKLSNVVRFLLYFYKKAYSEKKIKEYKQLPNLIVYLLKNNIVPDNLKKSIGENLPTIQRYMSEELLSNQYLFPTLLNLFSHGLTEATFKKVFHIPKKMMNGRIKIKYNGKHPNINNIRINIGKQKQKYDELYVSKAIDFLKSIMKSSEIPDINEIFIKSKFNYNDNSDNYFDDLKKIIDSTDSQRSFYIYNLFKNGDKFIDSYYDILCNSLFFEEYFQYSAVGIEHILPKSKLIYLVKIALTFKLKDNNLLFDLITNLIKFANTSYFVQCYVTTSCNSGAKERRRWGTTIENYSNILYFLKEIFECYEVCSYNYKSGIQLEDYDVIYNDNRRSTKLGNLSDYFKKININSEESSSYYNKENEIITPRNLVDTIILPVNTKIEYQTKKGNIFKTIKMLNEIGKVISSIEEKGNKSLEFFNEDFITKNGLEEINEEKSDKYIKKFIKNTVSKDIITDEDIDTALTKISQFHGGDTVSLEEEREVTENNERTRDDADLGLTTTQIAVNNNGEIIKYRPGGYSPHITPAMLSKENDDVYHDIKLKLYDNNGKQQVKFNSKILGVVSYNMDNLISYFKSKVVEFNNKKYVVNQEYEVKKFNGKKWGNFTPYLSSLKSKDKKNLIEELKGKVKAFEDKNVFIDYENNFSIRIDGKKKRFYTYANENTNSKNIENFQKEFNKEYPYGEIENIDKIMKSVADMLEELPKDSEEKINLEKKINKILNEVMSPVSRQLNRRENLNKNNNNKKAVQTPKQTPIGYRNNNLQKITLDGKNKKINNNKTSSVEEIIETGLGSIIYNREIVDNSPNGSSIDGMKKYKDIFSDLKNNLNKVKNVEKGTGEGVSSDCLFVSIAEQLKEKSSKDVKDDILKYMGTNKGIFKGYFGDVDERIEDVKKNGWGDDWEIAAASFRYEVPILIVNKKEEDYYNLYLYNSQYIEKGNFPILLLRLNENHYNPILMNGTTSLHKFYNKKESNGFKVRNLSKFSPNKKNNNFGKRRRSIKRRRYIKRKSLKKSRSLRRFVGKRRSYKKSKSRRSRVSKKPTSANRKFAGKRRSYKRNNKINQ